MEFLIFSDWRDLYSMSPEQRSSYLAGEEAKQPLYTLPAGFRSVRKELKCVFSAKRVKLGMWEES